MINYVYKFAKLFIIAAKVDQLISELKLSEDIANFIKNIPESQLRYYIPEIRKNPQITLEQLKQIIIPEEKQKEERKNTDIEQHYVRNLDDKLKLWALIQFRKLRRASELDPNSVGGQNDDYREFKLTIQNGELNDWFVANNPNIASYDWKQALEASNKWHSEFTEDENDIYREGNVNIVYGPQWKNKEYDGWTIKRIFSENDLNVEGSKMQHCVGSYADRVNRESCAIYSLRDPQNEPHATLEESPPESGEFEQIRGKQNKEPIPQYKKMLGEWFSTLESVRLIEEEDILGNISFNDIVNYSGNYLEQTCDEIIEGLNSVNDYGLKQNISEYNITNAFEKIMENSKKRHDRSYTPSPLYDVIKELVNKAIDFYKQNTNNRALKEILEICQNEEEKKFDDFVEWNDSNSEYFEEQLNKDDFGSEEEYHDKINEMAWKSFDEEYKNAVPYSLIDKAMEIINKFMVENGIQNL